MRTRGWRRPVAAATAIAAGAVAAGVMLTLSLTDGARTETTELYGQSGVPAASTVNPPRSILGGDTGATLEDAGRFVSPARRMRIAEIDVDAPLVTVGIDQDGNMAAPTAGDVIGWYDFSGQPGEGSGNAVFAGHRDLRGYGPAVFWDLEQLQHGDLIEVELADGTEIRYQVTGMESYPVDQVDMREILASTDRETLTLITCAGAFENGDYEDRHIVRAVRMDATAGG